jgi:hypothetical protein
VKCHYRAQSESGSKNKREGPGTGLRDLTAKLASFKRWMKQIEYHPEPEEADLADELDQFDQLPVPFSRAIKYVSVV